MYAKKKKKKRKKKNKIIIWNCGQKNLFTEHANIMYVA